MTHKYIFKTTMAISVAILLILSACSDEFLDINDNPNEPVNPDLELLFPTAQVAYSTVIVHNTRLGDLGTLGQVYESTDSQYNFTGGTFDNAWDNFFTLALVNLEQIIASAPEAGLVAHAAVAKLQKAYVFATIIDIWGAAPFDEALNGEFAQPMWEDGAAVYPKVLALIDEALAELGGLAEGDPVPSSDVIYGGDVDNWIKMGNTLKLKMFINLANSGDGSAVSQIEALASGGNLISSNAEDFEFLYGNTLAPETRHRWHQTHYVATKTYYMSNSLMSRMIGARTENGESFGVQDPRLRYYFYRQLTDFDPTTTDAIVPDDFPCFGYGARFEDETTWKTVCAYGYQGNGYIGRDHGDGTGIPNDGGARTTFGVYPAGGLFDDNGAKTVAQSDGTGAGVVPLLTYSMVNFWLAEANLLYGANTGSTAEDHFREAVTSHISKVLAFPATAGVSVDPAFVPTPAEIDEYVNTVVAQFQAPDASRPLLASAEDVWAAQFQISLFGNPVEAYNLLRRTKLPIALTADISPNSMAIIPVNTYPRRLPYPQDELNTNPNATRQSETPWESTPVFWDTQAYPTRFDGN
ncbi:MAG: SusD/RagB family nutrient-binding outer membrane lipoprotein [Bacteroidota bacterium]